MSSTSSLIPLDDHDNIFCFRNANSKNQQQQQQQQQQRRHQSLPLPPPKPQSVNTRDHRHSWSRKPQLREIPEESQQPIKDDNESIYQTTQYILNEIKNLAGDILEAEARADTYKRLYSETLHELDAVRKEYQGIFQQLREQQEQERIKVQYYQDLIRRQSQQYSSSPSCYPSSSSSSTRKSSKKTSSSSSGSFPNRFIRFLGLSQK